MEEKELCFTDIPYGGHERQKFDLIIPAGYRDRHGLVLCIHGGAWIAGVKEQYSGTIREWCSLGYAAASINYRYISADTHMDALLSDITAALTAIRSLALEHGVTLEKMLLTGTSAGGHLSLLYAYAKAEESPIRPAGVVDYCGPAWLSDDNLLYGTPRNNPPEDRWYELYSNVIGFTVSREEEDRVKAALDIYSPVCYVSEKTVPTIICHGMRDTVVPFTNATALRDALEKNGVEYVFVPMPEAGHGLEQKEIFDETSALFRIWAERFLNG